MNAEDKADAEEIERYIQQIWKRWHKAPDLVEKTRLRRAIKIAEEKLERIDEKLERMEEDEKRGMGK